MKTTAEIEEREKEFNTEILNLKIKIDNSLEIIRSEIKSIDFYFAEMHLKNAIKSIK